MLSTKNKQILLIDDGKDNFDLLKLLLETQGYSVGEHGINLEKIAEKNHIKPDLIIFKYFSVEESIINSLNALKRQDYFATIPFLLLISLTESITESSILVDKICYTPFEIEKFFEIIRFLMMDSKMIRQTTLIMDVDEKDPLVSENKKLQSLFSEDSSPWSSLQQQGYKINQF